MSDLGLFLKQVVTKPTRVVAVVPSSKALAQRMAEAVPDGVGHVVELGAGTGKNLGWTRSQRIWGNLPPTTSYMFYRKRVS